ncbi:TetR/AcrR family transcriptional regulator [Superficieibacter electus]|uniref:TetR/AcrR family transcriptional regulator n=1 Tax=Superficieibacter electus TaxID=2022662 RepID=A0A2P5GRG1_9ENTR|nr:TetR/AcrR family transcriptional regulator [Superficieibacter electus]POP45834.1 TetR/AcrR family transcriptional regulator [Superficieibacter electus]POP49140.1 TetR/AcrR family transcriptional regulator [Superficieibacter electus]
MARPRTLDREALLNAAEAIIGNEGTQALSFGSIAIKAGVSKASVQSAFGSREKILDALLERWMEKEQARYLHYLGTLTDAQSQLQAHLCSTKEESNESGSRILTLLAAQIGSGAQSEYMKAWYQKRMGNFEATSREERKRRAIYLAAEGAIFIRNMVGYPIGDVVWNDIFNDLELMLNEQKESFGLKEP